MHRSIYLLDVWMQFACLYFLLSGSLRGPPRSARPSVWHLRCEALHRHRHFALMCHFFGQGLGGGLSGMRPACHRHASAHGTAHHAFSLSLSPSLSLSLSLQTHALQRPHDQASITTAPSECPVVLELLKSPKPWIHSEPLFTAFRISFQALNRSSSNCSPLSKTTPKRPETLRPKSQLAEIAAPNHLKPYKQALA